MNETTEFKPEIHEIDRLNLEAWNVRVTDSNRAFELSREALRLSSEIQYEKGKAEGLRTLGFCHIRLAKYHEALEMATQAHQMFVQMHDTRNQLVTHGHLGIIHRSLGDYSSSLEQLFTSLSLCEAGSFPEEETLVLYHLSTTYKFLGDLNNALEHALKGLLIAQEIGDLMPESYHLNCIGGVYFEMSRYEEAHEYYQKSLGIRRVISDQWGVAGCLDNIGNVYLKQGNYEQALKYCLQSLEITQSTGDRRGLGNTLFNTGKIYAEMHDYDNALDYCRQSLDIREVIGDKKGQAEVYCFLGGLYNDDAFSSANVRQSLNYLRKALALAEDLKTKDIAYKIHQNLSKTYKHLGELAQALYHYERYAALEKEVNNEAVQQRILNLQITHQVAQSQKESEIFRLKNVELVKLVEEVEQQKAQLQKTLDHLQATQTQLIQSEKLASLGELTAGIAHEIQNPLNFVNNFSELSVDLAKDIQEEMHKPEIDQAYVDELLTDLSQNQQKINHHGKRAAAIVSGMLQHARASTGKKEPTDLNALADEYLRLAYHGLRAKDPNFNCQLETRFDPALGMVEVIPQDMGRVLLNLINNAFYAVRDVVDPVVTVSTQKTGNQIIIKIKDNGAGIPEAVKAKIFQPFFTTKPTGQGTGLGLSLAYDIVVKGHGGALEVETKEGREAAFIVKLPAL